MPSEEQGKTKAAKTAEDVLEAFNAEGAIDHPGKPKADKSPSPAADSTAPSPPG
jgi:hypothetical protein